MKRILSVVLICVLLAGCAAAADREEPAILPIIETNPTISCEAQLIMDFNQSFADLICSMGTAGEQMVIGSAVNTYLSAFQAESVFFTVNGEILESGHVIYDFPLTFVE